jgi:hypothetical protein
MSKERPTIGTDGQPLPVLPPERDGRTWAKLVRVCVYTPGFLALLLLKAGEPSGFGITVELMMLASAAAVVAGLYIGTNSSSAGADHASRIGLWSGALVLELLAVVPILCAVPSLFHELASSALLHGKSAADIAAAAAQAPLGAAELLPMAAILPFMLYQLAGFGTLHYVVPKAVNWAINIGILVLIVASYVANRRGDFELEKACVGLLIVAMAATVFYGVLRLRQMQTDFDARHPPKESKDDKEEKAKKEKKDKK